MLGTQEQRTKGMKRQAQELIEQAYNSGFKAGREQGRKEGLEYAVYTLQIAQGRMDELTARQFCNLPEKDGVENE